jgi:hypothetical protein
VRTLTNKRISSTLDKFNDELVYIKVDVKITSGFKIVYLLIQMLCQLSPKLQD